MLLVDSDPQGSARDWHAAGDGQLINLVGLDRPTLDKDLKSVEAGDGWLIIDGAPQAHSLTVAAKGGRSHPDLCSTLPIRHLGYVGGG
jgi:chromosome partitioning protein